MSSVKCYMNSNKEEIISESNDMGSIHDEGLKERNVKFNGWR